MTEAIQVEMFERAGEVLVRVTRDMLPSVATLERFCAPPDKVLLDSMRSNGWRGVVLVTVMADGTLDVRDGKRRTWAWHILAAEKVEPWCDEGFGITGYARDWQGLEDLVDAFAVNRTARPNRQADFDALRRMVDSGMSLDEIAKATRERRGSIEKLAKLFDLPTALLDAFLAGNIPYTAADLLASMDAERKGQAIALLERQGKLTVKDVRLLRRATASAAGEAFAQEMFEGMQGPEEWPLLVEGDYATVVTPDGKFVVLVEEFTAWLAAQKEDE